MFKLNKIDNKDTTAAPVNVNLVPLLLILNWKLIEGGEK